MNALDHQAIQRSLAPHFGDLLRTSQKRPQVVQLSLPYYHEDGDRFDIYLKQKEDGAFLLTDAAMTVMRLSYSYDLSTEKKLEVFHRILKENALAEDDGAIQLEVPSLSVLPAYIYQYAQGLAKVSSMKYFSREVVASLFFEELEDFVNEKLAQYHPQRKVYPIEGKEEYPVDFLLKPDNSPKSVYLFGINSNDKANLATIVCQQALLMNQAFVSVVVCEDVERLSKKHRKRLSDVCDKPYSSLAACREFGTQYLERQFAQV